MGILKKILMSLLIVTPMAAAASTLVNINKANAFQLREDLTGVTKKTSERIVNYRKMHGPFKSKEDLVNIEGLGRDFVNLNRDYITLGNQSDNSSS